MRAIEIRKADVSDAHLLFTICRLAYSENFANHWNEGGLEWYLNQVYSLEGIKSDLQHEDIHYYVAFDGTEPLGFMKINLKSNLPDQPSENGLEVEKIYFRPQHQGKGIGKKLMMVAINLAKTLGKKQVWLGVIDTNPAFEFYKKLGFLVHDRSKLELPYFKEELKGIWRMKLVLSEG